MGLLIASILCNSNIEIGFLSRAIDTRGVVNHDVYHVFHGTASSLHSIRTLPPWPWSIPPKQSLTGGLPLPRPLPRYGSVLLEQSLMATYRGKKPNILEPPWGHSQKSLHLKKDQSSPLPSHTWSAPFSQQCEARSSLIALSVTDRPYAISGSRVYDTDIWIFGLMILPWSEFGFVGFAFIRIGYGYGFGLIKSMLNSNDRSIFISNRKHGERLIFSPFSLGLWWQLHLVYDMEHAIICRSSLIESSW